MRTTKIRTIARASVNALAYQGIMPCESFAQIHDTLLRHFGESHALAFAEPVFNKHSGFVDWYVSFEGEVLPYRDLGEEEKAALTAGFSTIAHDIKAYADSLIASGDPQKVTRGNILHLALLYPGEEDLFLVDKKPVVTCWGFASGTEGAPVQNLCELAHAQPKEPVSDKPPIVAEPVRRGFFFLPWLLPLFLLLLLLLFLFADVGSIRSISGVTALTLPSLFAQEEAREAELRSKRQELEAMRKELEQRVLEHIALCRPKKKAETRQSEPAKEALVIPENVKDTGFLRGRWRCATGLYNAQTQEPVTVEFVFNKKGEGVGRIFQREDVCSGKATARLVDGVLHISHDTLRCAKSEGAYAPNEISCKNTGAGQTECRGRSAGGLEWNAFFLRLLEE